MNKFRGVNFILVHVLVLLHINFAMISEKRLKYCSAFCVQSDKTDLVAIYF